MTQACKRLLPSIYWILESWIYDRGIGIEARRQPISSVTDQTTLATKNIKRDWGLGYVSASYLPHVRSPNLEPAADWGLGPNGKYVCGKQAYKSESQVKRTPDDHRRASMPTRILLVSVGACRRRIEERVAVWDFGVRADALEGAEAQAQSISHKTPGCIEDPRMQQIQKLRKCISPSTY